MKGTANTPWNQNVVEKKTVSREKTEEFNKKPHD
jgi:hypothetical protein